MTLMDTVLKIGILGMTCQHCAVRVAAALSGVVGDMPLTVDHEQHEARLTLFEVGGT